MTAAEGKGEELAMEQQQQKKKKVQDDDSDGCDDLNSYDALTEVMGKFGMFHLITYLSLYASVTPHALQMMENKWLTQPTDYWCARPAGLEGVDPETWVNMSAPLKLNGEYDRCRTFDVDFELNELERPAEDTPTRECTEFEYDTSEFRNTAIQRWDLVCSRKYVTSYVQTIFFIGNFVGVVASGPIADTFGRKFCYCLFVTIWIASGVIGSMAANLNVWIMTRFVCGAMSLGYNNVLSAYSTELTSGRWRAMQGYFFGANAWDSGVILLGFMAYMIRDMRMLELTVALSNVPFLLAWFLMQESPRWLLSKGKKERAKVVIKRVCRLNKRPIDVVEPFVDNFEMTEEEQKGNILDLFRTPNIRRNTLLMCLCWLSFSMGYFGLFYNIPNFNWNPFLVFIIPAIPSIPSNFIEPHLENFFGRKAMLTASLLLAGTFLFLTLTFPKEHPGIIVCAWVGAYFCGIAFGAGYTYTKELYPTVLRSTALGTASAAARIGSILSPTIALSAAIHQVMPLILYGATLFAAGIGAVWIWPETKRIHLFYTLEECERAAATKNTWTHLQCCSKKQNIIEK